MTFDKLCFWGSLILLTWFLSVILWIAFKALSVSPEIVVGTYAVILAIGAIVAKFNPETRHPILALTIAVLAAIPVMI